MHACTMRDDYLIAQALRVMLELLGLTSFSFACSERTAVMDANEQKIDLITDDAYLLPATHEGQSCPPRRP